MALFLMTVMAICFIVFSVITAILSFYKDGKALKKKWVFIILTVLTLGELFISLTSLPSNYLIKKIIDIILMIALIGNLFVYEKKFNTSRLILGVTSILALFALFEF
ncbi:MAG: hypothetical protein RR942_11090 [Romboutsia sp.]|uniref:hypothetical protein n=1 Tax=Paraclostridium sp. TaxID=2023273 RepID=UPI003AA139DA